MKRFLFLLVASLTLFTGTVHAQRALPRMRSIELRGGMADGFCTSASTDAGYYGPQNEACKVCDADFG